jgi:hypothetical protein
MKKKQRKSYTAAFKVKIALEAIKLMSGHLL